ncbi:hypothetical protein [Sporosarcina sp. ANT_H38]
MVSIYSLIYQDVVNSPQGKIQNQLDILSNTHYQLGAPNILTFNMPSAKMDIPMSIKSGDINWAMVRTKGAKKGRGLTNAEASAKYGLAPILDDASSDATLHHSQQKGVGPLYEASTRYHNISNAKRAPLHPYKGKLNPFYPMDEKLEVHFKK